MVKLYKVIGINFKVIFLGELDCLLIILILEYGLIRVVVFGVRK